MRACVALMCWLLLAPALSADTEVDAEIRGLQAALNSIQQEQQSVYQQFQMIQQLRQHEQQSLSMQITVNPPVYPDGNPPNYDDLVKQQRERDQRLRYYTDELDRLYARYKELEAEKRPILDRIHELVQR